MLNIFKKKPPSPEIRDVLFGDLHISQWPGDAGSSDSEPWLSFIEARIHMNSGSTDKAIEVYQRILGIEGLESRHYAQAWHFLRGAGVHPDPTVAKQLYGVVVEMALRQGLDIVTAYADHTARYFNHSGAAVVWDAVDNSLHEGIDNVLRAGKAVVDETGPWKEARPSAPQKGQARINMLTPGGLHFGQASIEALTEDRLGGAVIAAAGELMKKMVAMKEKGKE